MEESDFWWLSKEVNRATLFINVGHHQPLTDDDQPQSVKWFQSFNAANQLSTSEKPYLLHFLSQWRSACKNTNVYRTLKVSTDGAAAKVLVGPFLIDIDANGYTEDLDDALDVARKAVKLLTNDCHVGIENMRVFFSGRKGFNIEVRPEALCITGSFDDQTKLSAKKLDDIIAALRQVNGVTNSSINAVSNQGTVIDRIYGGRFSNYTLKHPYIRLHHSINRWVQRDGNEIARMKIEVRLIELSSVKAKDICSKAEKLESDSLGSQ